MTPPVTTHARERAEQRFGRPLTEEEWCSLALAIVERRALLTRKHADCETYAVQLGGVVVQVVWCPTSASIVTVMEGGSRKWVHLPPRELPRAYRGGKMVQWHGRRNA